LATAPTTQEAGANIPTLQAILAIGATTLATAVTALTTVLKTFLKNPPNFNLI